MYCIQNLMTRYTTTKQIDIHTRATSPSNRNTYMPNDLLVKRFGYVRINENQL